MTRLRAGLAATVVLSLGFGGCMFDSIFGKKAVPKPALKPAPKARRMAVTVQPMQVTAVHYEWSNPSMGPHSKSGRRSLDVRERPDVAKQFLDETVVNGMVSVRELIQLHLDEDGMRLKLVRDTAPEDPWNEGTTILTVVIELADGRRVDLGDRRGLAFEGAGFVAFSKVMDAEGVTQDTTDGPGAERLR